MARCINNEKHGRKVFYGAMIAEGVIGLIWVTLGMSFYPDTATPCKQIQKIGIIQ
jgi:carbon starvation protein CstA